MSLAHKPVYSSRPFLTAPYLVDGAGILRPARPNRCPVGPNTYICKVSWHGWRHRKCGPGYPLAKARCRSHDCTFTVYPLGWSPFGRRRAVVVSHAGFDVEDYGAGLDAWTETVFGASSDAAAGCRWPNSAADVVAWRVRYEREPYGVARTQRRHIEGVSALFALAPKLEGRQAGVVAAIGVNLSDIAQAAGRVRDGPALVAEGKKGAAILRILGTPRRRLLPGINRLGVDREYWGPPFSTNHHHHHSW